MLIPAVSVDQDLHLVQLDLEKRSIATSGLTEDLADRDVLEALFGESGELVVLTAKNSSVQVEYFRVTGGALASSSISDVDTGSLRIVSTVEGLAREKGEVFIGAGFKVDERGIWIVQASAAADATYSFFPVRSERFRVGLVRGDDSMTLFVSEGLVGPDEIVEVDGESLVLVARSPFPKRFSDPDSILRICGKLLGVEERADANQRALDLSVYTDGASTTSGAGRGMLVRAVYGHIFLVPSGDFLHLVANATYLREDRHMEGAVEYRQLETRELELCEIPTR